MEETSFWDRLRDNVSRGIRVAADRTDELARVGKLKLDLVNLKRKMVYELGELGKRLLTLVDSTPKKKNLETIEDFITQPEIKEHFDKSNDIRGDIADIEKRIKDLSKDADSTSGDEEKPQEETTAEEASPDDQKPAKTSKKSKST